MTFSCNFFSLAMAKWTLTVTMKRYVFFFCCHCLISFCGSSSFGALSSSIDLSGVNSVLDRNKQTNPMYVYFEGLTVLLLFFLLFPRLILLLFNFNTITMYNFLLKCNEPYCLKNSQWNVQANPCETKESMEKKYLSNLFSDFSSMEIALNATKSQ